MGGQRLRLIAGRSSVGWGHQDSFCGTVLSVAGSLHCHPLTLSISGAGPLSSPCQALQPPPTASHASLLLCGFLLFHSAAASPWHCPSASSLPLYRQRHASPLMHPAPPVSSSPTVVMQSKCILTTEGLAPASSCPPPLLSHRRYPLLISPTCNCDACETGHRATVVLAPKAAETMRQRNLPAIAVVLPQAAETRASRYSSGPASGCRQLTKTVQEQRAHSCPAHGCRDPRERAHSCRCGPASGQTSENPTPPITGPVPPSDLPGCGAVVLQGGECQCHETIACKSTAVQSLYCCSKHLSVLLLHAPHSIRKFLGRCPTTAPWPWRSFPGAPLPSASSRPGSKRPSAGALSRGTAYSRHPAPQPAPQHLSTSAHPAPQPAASPASTSASTSAPQHT